ncbi:hypothetical protein ABIB62_003657 [Mucilaginibacter sp. UYP25]|uniref:hypothetical protein n=1 Tax=unclassified Mucilaginibacter TaxID=2617802 RepID=UPI00339216EA
MILSVDRFRGIGRWALVRVALLLKMVYNKESTARPLSSMSGGKIKPSGIAAKKQNDTYTRWNHAATAGGFIAPRAIAPGFIAPSASLPLAGMIFASAHNIPALPSLSRKFNVSVIKYRICNYSVLVFTPLVYHLLILSFTAKEKSLMQLL